MPAACATSASEIESKPRSSMSVPSAAKSRLRVSSRCSTSEPPLGRIEPDTKDWTWVLQRRCPECGMAAGAIVAAEVPDLLRGYAERWAEVLRRPDVAARPEPTVWSPLEYGCHVRDVCRLMQWRAELMLTEDFPTFPDWDQDATALAEH